MDAKQEIRIRLEQLLKAWEGGAELLEECVDEEPYAYFSTFGIGYTRDDIRRWFSMRGKPAALSVRIVHDVVRIRGEEALQYANVIGMFTDNAVYQKHLAWGGSFVNRLVKTERGWKLKVLRFDLRCEDSVGETMLSREGMLYRATGYGQPSFMAGWLKIDDRIGHNMSAIPGTGERMISPDYDTPWYAMKEPDLMPDDETQVKELLLRYCYAFDFATFPLLVDALDERVRYTFAGNRFHTRRDTIGFLKMYRKRTPRSFHAVEFEEVRVEGKEAFVSARRIAPDLRSRREAGEGFEQWVDGVYRYRAAKEEAGWVITELGYDKIGQKGAVKEQ